MAHLLIRESYIVDYAGLWSRAAAAIIDGALLWGFYTLFNGLWNLAFGIPWTGVTPEMIQQGKTTVPFWELRFLLFFATIIMYFAGFWAWRGQTPGKMVFRIKVTRFDGSPIGWGGAFLRICGYVFSTFILTIGFWWLAFDSRRQGIHDKIAETFVVRIPGQKELDSWKSTIDSKNLP
jgi:uncharacterized RDD family membrane protein YckC